MKKKPKQKFLSSTKRAGFTLVAIGASIIIALIMPFWFWWFIIGVALFSGGIWLLKR